MKVKRIQVFEYDTLVVGRNYGPDEQLFGPEHFEGLSQYLTRNQGCSFYTLLHKKVKFNQYVGVLSVNGLTIEVLPKTDRHSQEKDVWQQVLIKMLMISLQVNAKTTTTASVNIKKLNVLEAYLLLFITEVEKLLHEGLLKKYRTNVGNQTALKGRLLIHQQVSQNLVHAERFYVAHQVYDSDNVFNSILLKALGCVKYLTGNTEILSRASSALLYFPECKNVKATERLFRKLSYNRKSERYKTPIELARIILLNYHPDFKGGANNILAIMVDMNQLWENYVYYILKKACRLKGDGYDVSPQMKAHFWQHPDKWPLKLKPDLLLEVNGRQVVIDTKWKFQSRTSVEDVRQMYAYGHYFISKEAYLLYPDKLFAEQPIIKRNGIFYAPGEKETYSEQKCGLIWLDLLDGNKLNLDVGTSLIDTLIRPEITL